MKRLLAALLAALLLCGGLMAAASADRMYLIPDSNTRYLTEDELWQWDYESLGYIYNEIFARHGYVFTSGGKYDYYFSTMPWYKPGVKNGAYNKIEWANKDLIKKVREDMRAQGTTNPGGKSLWTEYDSGFNALQGFDYVQMKTNQKLAVYSAPGTDSWRGANGKASVSTNGAIMAAGQESGWLLMMYETNNGGVRVGYVNSGSVKGRVDGDAWTRQLRFEYTKATVKETCTLTDDPIRQSTSILTLRPGDTVTYLTTYFSNSGWDYVETVTDDGEKTRGFIPANMLDNGTEDAAQDDSIEIAEGDYAG